MSVPKKMQEFAALYGCEITEGYVTEHEMPYEALFARATDVKDAEPVFICRIYNARFVNKLTLNDILQRVSGRTLAQFWTHKTGEEVVQEVQANKQRGMKKEQP